MAGKSPSALSGREYAILKILWEQGPLSVREVRERLDGGEEGEIPYTTVLSLLQLMEKKGYVGHEADGKTYRYSAKVARAKTTKMVIGDFLSRFFDGSVEALLMGLAEGRELTPEAWEKLNDEIRKREGGPPR
ncbi:BlaI/MecI/CopY family transcriptional regulator [Singulisphaera sp. PoT]|uniref:BlaI/MecI/CopY family transcriptional regulator n=1 Tax=Singulisphaera sp. PoT TaxID=3411797 RepID=UPI003BF58DDC